MGGGSERSGVGGGGAVSNQLSSKAANKSKLLKKIEERNVSISNAKRRWVENCDCSKDQPPGCEIQCTSSRDGRCYRYRLDILRLAGFSLSTVWVHSL